MLDIVPNTEQMTALLGKSLYEIWNKLCVLIDEKYDMDCLWDKGGKAWTYEYKYRRGGKTLCALYARENCIGFMTKPKLITMGNGLCLSQQIPPYLMTLSDCCVLKGNQTKNKECDSLVLTFVTL